MRPLITGLLAASAIVSTGCYSGVRIGRILADPARYQNRKVQVSGVVTGSANALVAGFYQIEDDSGRITVLSNGGVPRKGTRVSLTGRVTSGVSVMGQSFGTAIRERDRHVHY